LLKDEILGILKKNRGYISGQELSEKLNISRTAVWKTVGKLKADGYRIEAVRNRGYRFLSGTDVLNGTELKEVLKGNPFVRKSEFYPSIDSTNRRAKELGESGETGPLLVVADEQTAGRGRRGRSWVSPPGTGIWMTLLYKPDIPAERASMLTLVTALSVAAGIRDMTELETKIKWPNDIVVNGKKVCGILTEMSTDMDGIRYVVTGTGINANTQSFPPEIRDTATSLFLESGKEVDRTRIIGAIMAEFAAYYGIFAGSGDMRFLKGYYESILVNKGKQVMVLDPAGSYKGRADGITDTGELKVTKEDGTQTEVRSGEVSVRGIYGYT